MNELEKYFHTAIGERHQYSINGWDFDYFRDILLEAIIKLNDQTFCDALVCFFDVKHQGLRVSAAATMLRLGDKRGICILVDALNAEVWAVRVKAAEVLMEHGDQRGWDILVKALAEDVEDDWFVKNGIVKTLANFDGKQAVNPLIDFLNNSDTCCFDHMLIGDVITCLAVLGDGRAIEPIRKWQYRELFNCDEDIVEKAIFALELKTNDWLSV